MDKLELLFDEIKEVKEQQAEIIKNLELIMSMNNDLINANYKLSTELKGGDKLSGDKQLGIKKINDKFAEKTNELYYGINGSNGIYIYGSTYDVKSEIKSIGGKWDKSNTRWNIDNCDEDKLVEMFPNIIKHQLGNKCLLD